MQRIAATKRDGAGLTLHSPYGCEAHHADSSTRLNPARVAPMSAVWAAVPRGAGTGRIWAIDRIGYRVPRARFDGSIHAVFARVCYIDCGDTLLTLDAVGADGPTTLLSARHMAPDMRSAFRRGAAVRCHEGLLHSGGTTLDLRNAQTWHAPDLRPMLSYGEMVSRVTLASTRLAQVRRTRSSVLDRIGSATIGQVTRACRDLALMDAIDCCARLVGWGEGLTPAGDDYLVGLCSGLGALADEDAARRAFVGRIRTFLGAAGARTTPIAAHCLALAACGDFNANILRAVDAVRAEPDPSLALRTLDEIMAVGATSGADTLTGILSAFTAWTHPAAIGYAS
jgi:hypothetical protein